jgi:uncharacterized membrane protein YphA (DoxX/SURF4 family)
MNSMQHASSMALLRWSTGLVVLLESYRFATSAAPVQHLQRMGLPVWIAPVLAAVEIAAAIAFLVPKLRRSGGYALLAVFATAALLHILHRQFDIGPLVVYSAAVLVCVAEGTPEKS